MTAADIIGTAETLILGIPATDTEVILQVLKVYHRLLGQLARDRPNLDF
jgi:hypothetical protein